MFRSLCFICLLWSLCLRTQQYALFICNRTTKYCYFYRAFPVDCSLEIDSLVNSELEFGWMKLLDYKVKKNRDNMRYFLIKLTC